MNYKAALVAFCVALPSTTVLAQNVANEVEITRSDIQADRKALVAHNMTFTEAEATAFWPVYNQYREDMRKIDDRLVKVITDYANSYETLTDTQAQQLLSDLVKARGDKVKLASDYVKQFAKVLPARKVARFYQVENRLDLIVQASVAEAVPLVK